MEMMENHEIDEATADEVEAQLDIALENDPTKGDSLGHPVIRRVDTGSRPVAKPDNFEYGSTGSHGANRTTPLIHATPSKPGQPTNKLQEAVQRQGAQAVRIAVRRGNSEEVARSHARQMLRRIGNGRR
jgi:hypothetical protein